ncbi:uncharacterized protein LOC62_01G001705 [Vanrija pseudolonga]|uniref:Uncharacterized protein n=1 Tax=Vanrija pseudolonga TaxID=143232 RepID=A0AAF0Y163_9TREE|nr:hypothetical protein LOC62_01G001705 [Vanrija pseudolonga]
MLLTSLATALACSLLASASGIRPRAGATLTLSPDNVVQCKNTVISWTGKGPFAFQVGAWRSENGVESFLVNHAESFTNATSYKWLVPYAVQSRVGIQLITADRQVIWRNLTVVGTLHNDDSCLIPTGFTSSAKPSVTATPTKPVSSPPVSSYKPTTTSASSPPLATAPNWFLEWKGDFWRCEYNNIGYQAPRGSQATPTLIIILQDGSRVVKDLQTGAGFYGFQVNTSSRWISAYIYDSDGNYGVLPPKEITGTDTSCLKK